MTNRENVLRKITRLLSYLVLPALCSAAIATESTRLYKHFEFGMPRATILKLPSIYDCSADFEKGAICQANDTFAGVPVETGFRFLSNKLVSIVLYTDFSQENHLQLMAAFKSKLQLIQLDSPKGVFDFLSELKKVKLNQFQHNISTFEQQALATGRIKYSFIENSVFKKFAKSSTNFAELIRQANNNLRVAEYSIIEEGESLITVIQFSAPKEALQLIQRKSQQKYDDF